MSARRCRLLLEFLTWICHRIFQVVTARTTAARGPSWWRGYLQSEWTFRFLQYRWWAAWLFNDGLTRHTTEFQFRIPQYLILRPTISSLGTYSTTELNAYFADKNEKKKENYTNSNFANNLLAIETNVLFPRRNANNADEYKCKEINIKVVEKLSKTDCSRCDQIGHGNSSNKLWQRLRRNRVPSRLPVSRLFNFFSNFSTKGGREEGWRSLPRCGLGYKSSWRSRKSFLPRQWLSPRPRPRRSMFAGAWTRNWSLRKCL